MTAKVNNSSPTPSGTKTVLSYTHILRADAIFSREDPALTSIQIWFVSLCLTGRCQFLLCFRLQIHRADTKSLSGFPIIS